MNSRLLLGLLLISLFIVSCQKKDELIGDWERFGDSFSGLKIQVKKEGESFKAIIVETTDSCKSLGGFVVGDIKWKNIKNTEASKYEFEDLIKGEITAGRFEPSYDISYLELFSENELRTRGFSKGLEVIGTEQKWRRISKD